MRKTLAALGWIEEVRWVAATGWVEVGCEECRGMHLEGGCHGLHCTHEARSVAGSEQLNARVNG